MSNTAFLTIDYWSLLLLFGALQGWFFALVLFFYRSGRSDSNKILAFLLTIFSLHLTEYVAISAGAYQQMPHVIAATLPVVFLTGPLYYLYTASLLTRKFRIDIKRTLHFLPALLCYLIFLPFYTSPAEAKAAELSTILEDGYVVFPLGLFVVMALSSVQMLVYFYLAYADLQRFETAFKQNAASTSILNLSWLKRISLGFSLYIFLFFVAYFQLFFLRGHRQEVSYAPVLLLAFFIHMVAYHAIRYPGIFAADGREGTAPKYQKTALTEKRSCEIRDKLLAHMASEKPFLQPDLKLSDIANTLNILPNHLSQVINAELDKNFFDFVNEYRVEEAKRKLLDDRYGHYTILAIALDAGFSNKASFNRVFKKHTGHTPSEFVRAEKG